MKRHCSSFTVTVPGEQVNEVVLWKSEVVNKKVKREVVSIDTLLQSNRLLVTEFR